MTTTTIRTARNYSEVSNAIEKLHEFKHSSMSAKIRTYSVSSGMAPAEEMEMLNNLIKTEPVYVVFSYSTPIAWMGLETKQPYFAARRYSQTTTRHQSLALRALA